MLQFSEIGLVEQVNFASGWGLLFLSLSNSFLPGRSRREIRLVERMKFASG